MKFTEMAGVMYEFFKGAPDRQPSRPQPVISLDSLDIVTRPERVEQLTWFGHSAFLLEMGGKKILIDPMLGDVPSPHPWLGSSRFTKELPIEIEKLPAIDAVIISHDHYDHLDYGSIMKLKDKVGQFYVPLGVGAHLSAWGVEDARIHELDWWEEAIHNDFIFTATPARHFSGRGIMDRFSTLWSSWVIQYGDRKIFFSGDSGYGPHFREIGEKMGPFNFAMIECGQYNEKWRDIHMMPEESAQAAIDLKAEIMMPIHWASFRLALHSWTDPIERVTKKAKELQVLITTPRIGEPIRLNDKTFPADPWWQKMSSNGQKRSDNSH